MQQIGATPGYCKLYCDHLNNFVCKQIFPTQGHITSEWFVRLITNQLDSQFTIWVISIWCNDISSLSYISHRDNQAEGQHVIFPLSLPLSLHCKQDLSRTLVLAMVKICALLVGYSLWKARPCHDTWGLALHQNYEGWSLLFLGLPCLYFQILKSQVTLWTVFLFFHKE